MYKLGLKLWSINTDYYLNHAIDLYKSGIYDYIELYVVPQSILHLEKWKILKQKYNIPFLIHNAHFMSGFNLSKNECEFQNREIYYETKKFADELDAEYIIFHGGIDGDIMETARQLSQFNESRALIENKPYLAVPNKMHGRYCRGYNIEEIEYVQKVCGCGFCLDIGHAICAGVSLGVDVYLYIEQFNSLSPQMYHLTDNKDISSPYDTHLHIGEGVLDIPRILNIIPKNSIITLETDKNSKENLNDFIKDITTMRNYENRQLLYN